MWKSSSNLLIRNQNQNKKNSQKPSLFDSNLINGAVVITNPWVLPLKILLSLPTRIVIGRCRACRWMTWCVIGAVLVVSVRPPRRSRRARRRATWIPPTASASSVRVLWAASSHHRQPNPEQDEQHNRLQHFKKHMSMIQTNKKQKVLSFMNDPDRHTYIYKRVYWLDQSRFCLFSIKSLLLSHRFNMSESVNFSLVTLKK